MGHLQDNRCMSEAQEQEAVIQYCDLKHIPVYHVPNGGYRNAREGARLKQGVKPGFDYQSECHCSKTND